MNGIHLDIERISGIPGEENIFELRRKIYGKLITKVHEYIDYLYNLLAGEKKIEDIKKRSIRPQINKESLSYLYRGVEIPLLGKTSIVLDNVDYVPLFQMVDKPIHLQKDGKYIVVKNNIKNTFMKLDGKTCNVIYKNSAIPLLPYLLYIYDSVETMLNDLGFCVFHYGDDDIDYENDDYFVIPEYYNSTFLCVKNNFDPDSWKAYFLRPFSKDNMSYHASVCNLMIDQINNEIIPEVLDENGNSRKMEDVENTSEIDDELRAKKEQRKNVTKKQLREYNLIPHNQTDENLEKIFSIINAYHSSSKKNRRTITKLYLESSLFKYMCKDITMDNVSVFDLITSNIRENALISKYYHINDIGQKNIRFMEWYAMKLSSVQAYPEQNIIMDSAKVEQKRVYNNSVNPISELAMMSRVNLFGKGALPKESCNASIRNLHNSYLGVIDPIDSSAGQSIGISLHHCPEVFSENMCAEVERLHENNTFMKLFLLDEKTREENTAGEDDKNE